ncbi:MAG: endonuclease/exonuclease/phosphatase family protein [Calditrichia bacterium]
MRALIFNLFSFILIVSFSVNAQNLKIATYNIYFLDAGISPQRKANLQTVIQELDADVIGFEEIDNPAALKNILPENYAVAMIDDPEQVQEVALAVRAPLQINSYKYIFPDTAYDYAFPRTRDLLQVNVTAYGEEFVFLIHHFKSRYGGRTNTDDRRVKAAAMIVDYIKGELSGKNIILMGDFNDNPDDRTLNVLEYGDPFAKGGIDSLEDSFLFNTSEKLLEKEYCSWGYNYHYKDITADTFDLVVAGSREENNKWRNKDYNYRKDVKIKEILFDQILVSLSLKDKVVDAGVFNGAAAVRGTKSRIKFTEKGVIYTRRGEFASDHVPVWVVLAF